MTAILFSIGVTHVWARGSIFARARALYPALLDCPLCAGVWISFCVQLGLWLLPTLTIAIGVACVSASASLAVYGLIRAIPVALKPKEAAEQAARAVMKHYGKSNEDAAFVARTDGLGRGFY